MEVIKSRSSLFSCSPLLVLLFLFECAHRFLILFLFAAHEEKGATVYVAAPQFFDGHAGMSLSLEQINVNMLKAMRYGQSSLHANLISAINEGVNLCFL